MNNKKENSINWWNLNLSQDDYLYLENAFKQKKISYNSIGKNLEKKLCEQMGCRFALVTTSGSVALLMALKAIGLKPGDEVILPNRTFQATANAVHFLGGVVRLVDVAKVDGLIDPEEIKKKITSKTKAIIAVHLNGRAARVEEIKKMIKDRNISIIEDTAQAFMCKKDNKYLGTMGDIGCLSFGVTKFITSGQGGAILTNSEYFYNEAKKFIFHAMTGEDDKEFNDFGFNFRQSDLLSSLALSQLDIIEEKSKKFISTYNIYSEFLKNLKVISLIQSDPGAGEIPIWIEILSERRDQLYQFLKASGIQTMKFYPSLNRSGYLNQDKEYFENSEIFEKKGLILPCGPDITTEMIDQVIKQLKKFEIKYAV